MPMFSLSWQANCSFKMKCFQLERTPPRLTLQCLHQSRIHLLLIAYIRTASNFHTALSLNVRSESCMHGYKENIFTHLLPVKRMFFTVCLKLGQWQSQTSLQSLKNWVFAWRALAHRGKKRCGVMVCVCVCPLSKLLGFKVSLLPYKHTHT